jgi:hypothetical protein
MTAEQSTRPEDTFRAREEGLTAEDFDQDMQEAPQRRCLTADEILDSEDRGHLDNWVPTPEWGGPGSGVYVLSPTAEDRERYEQVQKAKRVKRGKRTIEQKEMDVREIRERLVIDFACGEDGRRLFACHNREQQRETIRKLKAKAAAPIGRIADMAVQLMGWSDQDWEDLVGNSETDRS